MKNTPVVKTVLAGVSRDCFPRGLTTTRLGELAKNCGTSITPLTTIIENERDTMAAIQEAKDLGANAAVIYLGNFGPEGPLSLFARHFPGPIMACGAAEESRHTLIQGRGDALCGLLNASYNFGLRRHRVHIPQIPIGLSHELAPMISHFENVARVIIGLKNLKVFGFGPRPQDFNACNAPLQPFYDLGIEVMENSELDLLQAYKSINPDDPEIEAISAEMATELGQGNTYPDLLPKLARYELALLRYFEANLGASQYGVFADKCWPAFESEFGFVPCYVNSRMAARGIPVACEVDLYGAVSEYIAQLASLKAATLLDINNSVPSDLMSDYDRSIPNWDLWMGFHCGNTSSCQMKSCTMAYQLIMNRLMEDGGTPNITRGTLEGQLRPGPNTIFRLQGTADNYLTAYMAEGDIMDINPESFGGIGVFHTPDFGRFYRHILIGLRFPHHTAVAFDHCGEVLYDTMRLLGISNIFTPLPSHIPYNNENPFSLAKMAGK